MAEFYQMNTDEVIQKLESNRNGLKEKEVRERLKKYGFNELKEKERISALTIFLSQFKNFLVIILIIATIISAVFGEIIEGLAVVSKLTNVETDSQDWPKINLFVEKVEVLK